MNRASDSPLRIGIAGLGRLGKRHAEQLAHRALGARLVSACSPIEAERDWARNALGVTTLHADFDAFVRDPGIDAVVIVTPTALHADQTLAALAAGKHVFVEKPLSLSLADGERVMAEARRRPQQVLMVGFMRRFDPSYAQAFADVQAGTIGKPFLVRSQTCDQNDPDGFFVRFAPQSGGIFMDCTVHDIDLARWLLGRPRALRAFATGTIALHPGLADCGDVDNGLSIVEFDGGARAVFYASRTMAHGLEVSTEVIGTAGMLSVGVGAHRDRVERRTAHGVGHAATVDFLERFAVAFDRELQAFVDACRGGPVPLHVADAVEATRIGLAITQAFHSGQVTEV